MTDFHPASDCGVCGEWRDRPCDDCAGCGHATHRAPEDADAGGAMEASCVDCGNMIERASFGSFVGPWEAAL